MQPREQKQIKINSVLNFFELGKNMLALKAQEAGKGNCNTLMVACIKEAYLKIKDEMKAKTIFDSRKVL